jgi:hypothetical protein
VAVLPCFVVPTALAGGARRADCPSKVPAEAQRVFDDTVSAFRSANARSIVALMERGADARLLLSLQDVPRGTYASDQALRILENTYFKKRTVTALTETKDCPKGEGASFTRSFLLTTKTETTEASEHLTVHIHRVDVQGASSIWVLDSLESKLIPQK